MKRLNIIVAAVLAVFIAAAYAAPAIPVSAQSSAALSIVPRKDYTIEPGKSIDDTLVIRNLDSEQPLNLSLRVVDFTWNDDGGTPKLMLAEDAPQTTWSLKPFLEVPTEVSIPPSTSRTLDMSVAIPENHGGGSYYSAIVYSSGAPEGGNVGLSASGVTLVFTQVPGDAVQDLKLERFGAYREATAEREAGYRFINIEQPKMVAYTLKNSGNVTESPVGSITIRDIFGRDIVIGDVNPNKSLALIGQTRTYTACIKQEKEEIEFQGETTTTSKCAPAGLWPGYYRASLDLFYGQNGNQTREITGSASFWYLPYWFLIVVILAITAATIAVWRLVVKVRSRGGSGSSTAFGRKR